MVGIHIKGHSMASDGTSFWRGAFGLKALYNFWHEKPAEAAVQTIVDAGIVAGGASLPAAAIATGGLYVVSQGVRYGNDQLRSVGLGTADINESIITRKVREQKIDDFLNVVMRSLPEKTLPDTKENKYVNELINARSEMSAAEALLIERAKKMAAEEKALIGTVRDMSDQPKWRTDTHLIDDYQQKKEFLQKLILEHANDGPEGRKEIEGIVANATGTEVKKDTPKSRAKAIKAYYDELDHQQKIEKGNTEPANVPHASSPQAHTAALRGLPVDTTQQKTTDGHVPKVKATDGLSARQVAPA